MKNNIIYVIIGLLFNVIPVILELICEFSKLILLFALVILVIFGIGIAKYFNTPKKIDRRINTWMSISFGMTITLLGFIIFGFSPLNKDPDFIPCSAAVCEYVPTVQKTPPNPESTPTPTASVEPTEAPTITLDTKTPEPSPTTITGQYYCLAQNSETNFRKFPTILSSVFYNQVTEETPLYCYVFISYSHQIEGFIFSDPSTNLAKIWMRLDTQQIPPNKRYFIAPYAYVRADKLLTKDKKSINPFELPEYVIPEEVFNELFFH